MKQKMLDKWNKLNWRKKCCLHIGGGLLMLAMLIALLGALGAF